MCVDVYSISRPEQGRTGLSLAALAAVRKMSHSLRIKATEPREPSRPDTTCLIFTPPSRQHQHKERERKAENDDTLLEQDALLICRLGDGTDSAELKEEFHVLAVLNVM